MISRKNLLYPYDQPSQVVDVLNKHLEDEQFIEILTGSDEYIWVLVPSRFDIHAFCTLTGCRLEGDAEEEPIFSHYIDPDTELAQPYILNMHIYGRKGDKPSNQLLQFVFFNKERWKKII